MLFTHKLKYYFTIFITLFLIDHSYAEDFGSVIKVRGKFLAAAFLQEPSDINLKNYIVVDKHTIVALIKLIKIKNKIALFEITKGDAKKGQRILLSKNNKKTLISKKMLNNSPWGVEYQYTFGAYDSSLAAMKTSTIGHSFLARYLYGINPKYRLTLWGGIKVTQVKVTYDSSTTDSASDIAPLISARLSLFLNSDWSAYVFSSLDRYSVAKLLSTSDASHSFIYKSSNGIGAEKRWSHEITTNTDLALVFPNKSVTNSLKSGFEFGFSGVYDWRNIQFSYRGVYQHISTETGIDSGFFNTLIIGYGF